MVRVPSAAMPGTGPISRPISPPPLLGAAGGWGRATRTPFTSLSLSSAVTPRNEEGDSWQACRPSSQATPGAGEGLGGKATAGPALMRI